MKRTELHRSDFTLIEVLIALAITGIAAMGIFRLQTIGLEAAFYSELANRGAVIADSRIEQAIGVARSENSAPESDGGEVVDEELNVVFEWELEVEDGGEHFGDMAEGLRDLWKLRCRVRWEGINGEEGIELTRYLWEYNLAQ